MKRKSVAILLTAFATAAGQDTSEAGLFSKRTGDACEQNCPAPEKKCCLSCLKPTPAPRAGTAIAVPAVVTNQRADRQASKAESTAQKPADMPPAQDLEIKNRVDRLDSDVQVIKEQLRVLTTLIQENK